MGKRKKERKIAEPIIEAEIEEVVNEESEEGSIKIDSSVLVYQAEDGSLGIQYVGDVGLKDLQLLSTYLVKHTDAKWEQVLRKGGNLDA